MRQGVPRDDHRAERQRALGAAMPLCALAMFGSTLARLLLEPAASLLSSGRWIAYALQLAVAGGALLLGRRPLRRNFERVVLAGDILYTAAYAYLLLPAVGPLDRDLALSVKMLATAVLVPWAPRYQLLSAGVTVSFYLALLAIGGVAAEPTSVHQAIGVLAVAALSVGASAVTERQRGSLFRRGAELTRSREVLRERTARLQMVFDQLPAVLWSTDTDLRFASFAGSGLTDEGEPLRSLVGCHVADIVRIGGAADSSLAAHRRALAGEPSDYEMDWRGRVFQAHLEPLRAAGGAIAGTVGVALDVTERKLAEREKDRLAAESEQLLETATALARTGRELLGSTLDARLFPARLCELACQALGCDFAIGYVRRPDEDRFAPFGAHGLSPELWETIRVLKVRPESVESLTVRLARHDVVLLGADDAAEQRSARLLMPFGATRAVAMALRRRGELHGALVAGRLGPGEPFTPPQERTASGLAQLASLAFENTDLLAALERAGRLKSDFVATMSHELRTPLSNIIGYADLLLEGEFGSLSAEQREVVTRVLKSADELRELINSTLDLSRLESGQVKVELHEMVLGDLFEQVAGELEDQGGKPGVRLEWHAPPRSLRLWTDPAKLKVILKNLIGNALKFTEAGSVTVGAGAEDGGLEISVADTGIGIPPEALPFVFEPFRQAEESMTRRHGGVGLGLYIVRLLVEMLGGRVRVESELGRGTTFWVWMPCNAEGQLADEAVQPSLFGDRALNRSP